MMTRPYQSFFGLREPPFAATPDPAFLYLAPATAAVLSAVHAAMLSGDGFAVVTGDIGVGKSTFCRALIERFGDGSDTALVIDPGFDEVQLLRAILSDFGCPVAAGTADDVQALTETLRQFLLARHASGRRCMAVMDEAQSLSIEALLRLCALSNLETNKQKLLQVVLVGQSSLLSTLRSTRLGQLAQRVSHWYRLLPMDAAQTHGYVHHRLRRAGLEAALPIEPQACRLAHQATGGVPRQINTLFDRILQLISTHRRWSINEDDVRLACLGTPMEQRLGPNMMKSARPRRPVDGPRVERRVALWAGAVGAMMTAALVGFLAGRNLLDVGPTRLAAGPVTFATPLRGENKTEPVTSLDPASLGMSPIPVPIDAPMTPEAPPSVRTAPLASPAPVSPAVMPQPAPAVATPVPVDTEPRAIVVDVNPSVAPTVDAATLVKDQKPAPAPARWTPPASVPSVSAEDAFELFQQLHDRRILGDAKPGDAVITPARSADLMPPIKAAPPAQAPDGGWMVWVGVYDSSDEARQMTQIAMAHLAHADGSASFTAVGGFVGTQVLEGQAPRYVSLLGAFASEDDADAVASRLAMFGYECHAVEVDMATPQTSARLEG